MKNLRMSVLLVFALTVSLLTGCGDQELKESQKKPAGEVLRAGFEKQFEVESSHGKTNLALNVELPQELLSEANVAMVAPFLKDAKLSVEQDAMIKEGIAYSNFNAEAGGQKFAAELFMVSPTKMIVKTDLYEKAIVLDMEEMLEMAKTSSGLPEDKMDKIPATFNAAFSEEYQPAIKAALDIIDEAFKGVEPTTRETEEIEFSTGKETLDMMTYSYNSNDEILALGEKIGKNIIESEKMYDLLQSEEFTKLAGDQYKEEMPSKEEYQKAMKQAKEEFDNAFAEAKEEMNKNFELKDLTFKVGVGKDGYIRYSKIALEGTVKQEGIEVPFKLSMDSSIDNLNKVKKDDIKTIEISEEDSIDVMELIMSMMMGGM